MAYITGHDRSQLLLLPEAVDDYVGSDNPVRFIDAFVDGLDSRGSGVWPRCAEGDRPPGICAWDLLKLYIYGYLNRVRSSRRLEAETHRNIEVIWLLRHLKPDFKTIADFRRDNRNAFRHVFRQFVLLCRQLDLFGRELLAVDGTRIKAVNNKDRNFTRASLTQFIKAADAKLDDYLQRLDKSDATESAPGGSRVKNLAEKITAIRERRERYKDMLAELDQTGESQISLTDPDSRAMAAHTHVAVGYNVQIAVDAKHKLIVEQQVTNQVVDMGLLAQTAEPAKEVLGVERIAVVADRGYFKIEDIAACEKAGIDPYLPRPQRGPAVRAGLFRKDQFRYDPTSDSFLCPAGQRLHPYSSSLLRGLKKINYRNSRACRDCAIRSRCTGNQLRSVSRLENEAVLDRMQARIAQRPDILDQRRETVEHPFGSIKQWMNQGAFLMRGLEKVRGEFSLTALAYNLRRVLNIAGLPKADRRAPSLKATPEHPHLDRPRALSSITALEGSCTNCQPEKIPSALHRRRKAVFPHGLPGSGAGAPCCKIPARSQCRPWLRPLSHRH
jgi:transposase